MLADAVTILAVLAGLVFFVAGTAGCCASPIPHPACMR
jgi:hypothetical protein